MTTVSPFSTPVSFYMFPNPKLIHSFYNLYTMLVLTITSQCGHFLFSEDKMKPDIGYVDNLLKKTHYLDRILISLLKTSMETYSILVTQNVEQCRT